MEQPPTPTDFTIAINVHEPEYRPALLEALAEYGFPKYVYTNANDIANNRLSVAEGSAYVAVIGYEPGPLQTEGRHFIADVELETAVQLRLPILLFVRENPVEGFAKVNQQGFVGDWIHFRDYVLQNFPHESLPYAFVVLFKDEKDFRSKATHAIQSLRDYLLANARPDEQDAYSNVAQTKTAATQTAAPTRPRTWAPAAQKVLKHAQDLAFQSGRVGITSSCILFGMAELPTGGNDTCSFIGKALKETGHYKDEYYKFFNDLGSAAGQTEVKIQDLNVQASKNAKALLDNATDIASRVTRSKEISPRHILAALIAGGAPDSIALRRFVDKGLDLPKLSSDFLNFLRSRTDLASDDFARWAAILTPKTFQSGPAGYNSEYVGMGGTRKLDDSLGVKDWADQLAELIALRETKLPLAIGLFGNWGSGKSHFMNLMDQKLKSKMDDAKRNGGSDRWCTEIVPVYFNAWHYLDANLWASLVSQIFESLVIHLRPKVDELKKMQELLEEASGATARAAEEMKVAKGVTKQAQEELVLAEQSRRAQETFVEGLLHGLKSLLPEVNQNSIQDHAAELLGVEKKEVQTVQDLREVVTEARSLTRRTLAVAKQLWKHPWQFGFLVAMAAGIAVAAYVFVPQISQIGPRIASILGALVPFIIWIVPRLAEASRRLSQLETWTRQAETAQQNLRKTKEVEAATKNVTAAAAEEEHAKLKLAEATARENSLREQVENLRPERRLGRFIENRAQSMDYRGQLGLISLARRDFQELSDIFADKEALDKKVAAAKTDKEKAAIAKLSASIDRIVLFVDDLDRCQPEKVVDVLQAVHLLLAFPLFAVVVGVDQRCLKQSLRMQMKGLLTDEPSINGTNGTPKLKLDPDDDGLGRPATPLDYLEKIFHVPFHLPQMGQTGFENLIQRLTAPVEATTPKQREEIKPPLVQAPKPVVNNEPDIKTIVTETPPEPRTDPVAGNGTKESDPAEHTHDGDAPPLHMEAVIGSVPLQAWEREALRAYHPLIQTPRGATRLLNTYRLVRASVPKSEWEAFSGDKMSDGEFRIAMLLLAAAAGYPAQARQWFERLQTTPASKLFSEDAPDDPAWTKFKEVYEATFGYLVKPIDSEALTKWIRRVERFAF